LYGGVGQSDDDNGRESLPGVDLHLYDHPIQADHRAGMDACEHKGSLDLEAEIVNAWRVP
jgi:hypothetical protein